MRSTSSTLWDELDSLATKKGPVSEEVRHFKLREDHLVLSCARHRLATSGQLSRQNFLDQEIMDSIVQEDRNKADGIRDYYEKRILWMTLHGQDLTNYQQDLRTYLSMPKDEFTNKQFGLVYKLPEFYDGDLELDAIKQDANIKVVLTDGGPHVTFGTRSLRPVKRITINNRLDKEFVYWCKDEYDNLTKLTVNTHNQLNHIFAHFFNTRKTLQLMGNYRLATLRELEYWHLTKWELVDIDQI